MKLTVFSLFALMLLFISCTKSVKPEQLYGEWKYIKVENPNQQPSYTMPKEEVEANHPSILFSKSNNLMIMWGGKQLSNGTFKMEDRMIRYKENLEGGQTREFPFMIKEISANKLVFETMEQNFTKVTAVRIR